MQSKILHGRNLPINKQADNASHVVLNEINPRVFYGKHEDEII